MNIKLKKKKKHFQVKNCNTRLNDSELYRHCFLCSWLNLTKMLLIQGQITIECIIVETLKGEKKIRKIQITSYYHLIVTKKNLLNHNLLVNSNFL